MMTRVSKTSSFRIPFLVVLSAAVLATGCGKKEEKGPQQTPELPVLTLQPATAAVATDYSTMLEGRVNVEIRPQVDGTLQKILVDEGASVKAGQPLFRIDDRTLREQYNTAVAAQHAAEAGSSVAKLDAEKLVPLVKNNVVSEVQLRTARANYAAAKAGAEQARAAARAAGIRLGYAEIRAPVGGYIGRIPFRLGSLVMENQSEALTTLSDVSEMYAYFSISETEFSRFKQLYAGESIEEKLRNVPPVSLVLSDGTVYAEQGKVEAVSGQFDRETGSISMRAVFPNAKGLLRTGNTGKVRMEAIYSGVILVPQEATVELQDKVFVFVVGKGNAVTKQVITVLGKSGNSYIAGSGVRTGDIIATAGIEKLQDGQVIRPAAAAPAAEGQKK
jgi:membrane fusion protein (multidrug efflux system)